MVWNRCGRGRNCSSISSADGNGRSRTGAGFRALHTGPIRYGRVLGSIGCQMLVLRVSGITKTAITKHTAGTKIG
jgi:hypothetical protein